MKTEPQFPAAHSMDTTWFAVDQEGCVGEFDSGEDGGVPRDVASGGGAAAPNFDTYFIDALRVARVLIADDSDSDAPRDDGATAGATRTFTKPERALVELRSASEIASGYRDVPASSAETMISEPARWVLRERAPRIVATMEALSPEELTALSAHPDVRALIPESDFSGIYGVGDGQDGLFAFSHRGAASERADSAGAGLYQRRAIPRADPVRVAELPPAAREPLGKVIFPVRFADAATIQLADHFSQGDVETWGGAPLRDTPAAWQAWHEHQALDVRARRKRAVVALVAIVATAGIIVACLLRLAPHR